MEICIEFLEDKTAIIITHRIFSLFDFDKIVVLEEGRIVEEGTHQDLIERKGYYAVFVRSSSNWKRAGEETLCSFGMLGSFSEIDFWTRKRFWLFQKHLIFVSLLYFNQNF